jgi:hypothetical protein
MHPSFRVHLLLYSVLTMKWTCTLGLMLIALNSFAQKEDYIWVMGNLNNPVDSSFAATTIDFNNDPPNIELLYKFFPHFLTNASLCDKNGKLQLYFNGISVYNNKFEVINNGGEFQSISDYPLGYNVPQGALMLPMSDDFSQVCLLMCETNFFFHDSTWLTGCSPLTYSLINLDTINGSSVFEKKIPLTYDTLNSGQLTAVKHGNGRDWWVIGSPNRGGQMYQKFIVSPHGALWDHSQEVENTIKPGLGQAIFSPDGKWVAYYHVSGITDAITEIDIFEFDRCSGMLGEHFQFRDTLNSSLGGIAFSSSSRFMYTSHATKIYQWDLESDDIIGSRTLVAEYDGFLDENGLPTMFFYLKLAPNNKIYINVLPLVISRYLHVIEQPDLPGVACNVLQHAIQLPTYNIYGLPNHPVSRLGVMEGSPCDTLTTAVSELPSSEQRFAKVFPNPARGQVSIDLGTQPLEPVQWVLNDALGRQVRMLHIAVGQAAAQMDIQGLPPGFYVYQLQSNGQLLEAGKLVIE